VFVKCGLDNPPLSAVKFALAGHEAVAEEVSGSMSRPAFGETFVVARQRVFNEIRAIQEKSACGTDLKMGNVPVFSRDIHQKLKRIAATCGYQETLKITNPRARG
jgi:hypothetical protein